MRTFRSDNNAGICPEGLQAIVDANDGKHVTGYGDDEWTTRATDAFRAIFGAETAVFMVATGTAANTLAIASLSDPWQRVLCHAHAHLSDDELTAPERIAHIRVTTIETGRSRSKLTSQDIERHGANLRGDVHQPAPGVLTISNPTEFGEVYTADEVRSLCECAHAFGYRVHVDGARFANAVASLGCEPRELTADAGVDALSFGGTKNGLAFGETVLFFPQGDGSWFERATSTFAYHRKGTGHLLSKHRFVAAPFVSTLRDGVWLRHASHANAMASRLAMGLEEAGVMLQYPAQANGVFVTFEPSLNDAMIARGHQYYMFGDASWHLARLMCSFDTQDGEVDQFLADVGALVAQ